MPGERVNKGKPISIKLLTEPTEAELKALPRDRLLIVEEGMVLPGSIIRRAERRGISIFGFRPGEAANMINGAVGKWRAKDLGKPVLVVARNETWEVLRTCGLEYPVRRRRGEPSRLEKPPARRPVEVSPRRSRPRGRSRSKGPVLRRMFRG